MLLRLGAEDALMLGRGLAALLVVIILGVVITENQLNNLTERQEFEQALNVRRDETAGVYAAYFLGTGFKLRALYPVAGLSNTDTSLTVTAGGKRLTIPTVLYADLGQAEYWLVLWRRQFVSEALKTRQALDSYLDLLRPLIRDMVNSIKGKAKVRKLRQAELNRLIRANHCAELSMRLVRKRYINVKPYLYKTESQSAQSALIWLFVLLIQ